MLADGVFRTGDVAVASDRFEYWRDLMARMLCPMEMGSAYAADFRAETRLLRLGEVRVWPTRLQPMSWARTPRLIRQADPEFYHLTLARRGTVAISQAGREARCEPTGMYVVDTSRPWECVTDELTAIGLEVPKRLVPLRPAAVDRLLTRRLSGRDGVGALLAGLLTGLARQAGGLRSADTLPLETVVVDLFASTLAQHLDAEDSLPPETRTRSLKRRVWAFIERELGDPELGPRVVAVAHHISVSYLHRLVREEGTTVAALIRERRLERARGDLADPALRRVPVHVIAARWGFTHHATFTRAFQAAYGTTPRDHRLQALAPAPEAA
ncbi:helix-turn-helix domain-containing protein [Streptomyces sp. 4N509B]|uniref:AraC-like ligand-binding domain-containing protein n=1 Tax=Streptomyces sp. 4N509B TaxID=3457413 RepID=UPI003FD2EF21